MSAPEVIAGRYLLPFGRLQGWTPYVSPTPTSTATITPNLSWTPTLSPTVTMTPTPFPVHAKVIVPETELGGVIIRFQSDTRFQVEAWDPNIGASDGDGIGRVEFELLDQDGEQRYFWREYAAGYCVYGGNNLCKVMPSNLWGTLANGEYTLRARARATSGRWSAWDEVAFTLDKPPTSVPTSTPNPTSTPLPTDVPLPTDTPIASNTPRPTHTPVLSRTPACGSDNPYYPCLTPPRSSHDP
jgi:hypothetical protein